MPPDHQTSPDAVAGQERTVPPFELFASWLTEATASEPNDPTAMTLATVGADGRPVARMVLLKGLDPAGTPARGFVFYTNLGSRKAADLRAHPQAALLFHWKTLRRQVRVEGAVQNVTAAEADAYFASRPHQSRIGAWASDQSQKLDQRATLEARVADYAARYPGEVPRPPQWSGLRVVPDRFEFWRDMPFRLHDRSIYALNQTGTGAGTCWVQSSLYP